MGKCFSDGIGYVKLILKSFLGIIILLIIIIFYLLIFYTYRYEDTGKLDYDNDKIINVKDKDVDGDGLDNLSDPDADNDGIPNIEDIVNNARKLKWTIYDYFQGKHDNIGGKMGLIVCIDVPKIAYEKAGIYFEQLLREDYKKHRVYYNQEIGNDPSSKFFFRRVRNLYDYCKANNKLIKNCMTPQKGDLIFYGRWHIALVGEVYKDGTYDKIESSPFTFFTLEHKNKKWIAMDVGRILGINNKEWNRK